jgi:hypothetical protein
MLRRTLVLQQFYSAMNVEPLRGSLKKPFIQSPGLKPGAIDNLIFRNKTVSNICHQLLPKSPL